MINKIIQLIFKEKYIPKNHVELNQQMKELFCKHGEGLYYANMRQEGKNLLSKIIGFFSGGFTHTVLMLYFEDTLFNLSQEMNISVSLDEFYKSKIDVDKIKCLVIANSFDTGQVCCDFSYYQNRKMTIRKIQCTEQQERQIIDYIIERIGQPYDATGLVFYPLKWISKKFYKIFDSEYNYCSEFVYDACKSAGIRIAAKDNPSPGDIEKYNSFTILFNKK
jgi:hypothetical protein